MKDPLDEVSVFARKLIELEIKKDNLAYEAINVLTDYYILRSKKNLFLFLVYLQSLIISLEKPLLIVKLLNKLSKLNDACALDKHFVHL
jgi:hypothetical protein